MSHLAPAHVLLASGPSAPTSTYNRPSFDALRSITAVSGLVDGRDQARHATSLLSCDTSQADITKRENQRAIV